MDMEGVQEARLPAIKFSVVKEPGITKKYSNSLNFKKEVLRVFRGIEGIETKVKRTFFQEGIGKIITDDAALREAILNTKPCSNAFDKGISFINSLTNNESKEKTFSIKILNVNLEYDDNEEFKDILKDNGIVSWKRMASRSSSNPTSIILAEVGDYLTYSKLIKRETLINIGFGETLKIFPKFLIKQCFNCFKVGHLKKDCTNSWTCIDCGQSHAQSDECGRVKQCANCGESHSSVSRKCTVLKEAADKALTKLTGVPPKFTFPPQDGNFWHKNKKPESQQSFFNNPYPNNDEVTTNLTNLVTQKIESSLDEIINKVLDTVQQSIMAKIEKLIADMLKDKLESLDVLVNNLINANLDKRKKQNESRPSQTRSSSEQTPNSTHTSNSTQVTTSKSGNEQRNSNKQRQSQDNSQHQNGRNGHDTSLNGSLSQQESKKTRLNNHLPNNLNGH